MPINTFIDPAKMPNRSQPKAEFDRAMAEFYRLLPNFTGELNSFSAGLNALAAGGAYAFLYTFSSATGNVTPASGRIAFDTAAQNAATAMRTHWLTAGGVDVDALYEALRAGTSTIKGSVRVVKVADPSKWILFDVTAVSSRSSSTVARNLFLSPLAWSDSAPFANGDAVMLLFDRNGDRGAGVPSEYNLGGVTVGSPLLNIDFLTLFNSDCDTAKIEISGITASEGDDLILQFAVGGAVSAGTNYLGPAADGGGPTTATYSTSLRIGQLSSGVTSGSNYTLDIRGINSGGQKSIGIRGSTNTFNAYSIMKEGKFNLSNPITGFRLSTLKAGVAITGGVITVSGHRRWNSQGNT